MPKIPNIFEEELRSHTPARLDGDLLARLTASAEGTQTDLSNDDVEFEAFLGAVKPRAIPTALKDSLLSSIGDTPFAVDEKIVLFHKSTKATSTRRGSFLRYNVAAAAAVALLGTIAALMVPHPDGGKDKMAAGESPIENPAATGVAIETNFTRDSYKTRDEGVFWRSKNQPNRHIRLEFTDKVTMKNRKGEVFQFERPRYEDVIIPEKID
jgi:hypothetical protein